MRLNKLSPSRYPVCAAGLVKAVIQRTAEHRRGELCGTNTSHSRCILLDAVLGGQRVPAQRRLRNLPLHLAELSV